jgi:hypothetical protein
MGPFLDGHGEAVTAAFTVVLAISTIMLWISTRDAAVAGSHTAEIAERALTELEAPIIGVKIVSPGIEWDLGKKNFTGGILKYKFVNHGRTAATLYEIFDDVRIVRPGEGLPPHVKPVRGPPLPYGVFVPPNGETEPFSFNIFASMLGVVSTPGALQTTVPFFLGTVRYGDIFGNMYTMGFCFMFDDIGNRFIEAGGPDHSYCYKRRGMYKPPGAGTGDRHRRPPREMI